MAKVSSPGEVSTQKVAAVFASAEAAREAARLVRTELSLSDSQVLVISAGDRHPGRKLEPESRGIWQTLVRTHSILGLAGLAAGALVFYIAQGMNVRFVTASPGLSLLAALFFGAMGGMMLGGLITLRPDHDPYIYKVLEACRAGGSAVVVHAFNADQRDAAVAALAAARGDVVSSL